MSEINYILEEMKNMPEEETPFSDLNGDYGSMDKLGSAIADLTKMPATLEELKDILSNFNQCVKYWSTNWFEKKISMRFLFFLAILKSIEEQIDAIKLEGQDGITKPPCFIFEMLDKSGCSLERKNYTFDILQRLLQYFGAQLPNPRHHNGASLGKFFDFLQV